MSDDRVAREWTVREDVVTIDFVMHRTDCEDETGVCAWCTVA